MRWEELCECICQQFTRSWQEIENLLHHLDQERMVLHNGLADAARAFGFPSDSSLSTMPNVYTLAITLIILFLLMLVSLKKSKQLSEADNPFIVAETQDDEKGEEEQKEHKEEHITNNGFSTKDDFKQEQQQAPMDRPD